MTNPNCPVLENGSLCGLRVVAKGMCDKHYRRAKKHGDPLSGGATVYDGLRERFLAKVDQRSEDECWPWTSRVLPNGYPIFYMDRKYAYAHRVAYELFVCPVPDGMQVDHVRGRGCTMRHCVNWRHLEAVTPRENVHRTDSPPALQARQTHCKRGHAFDEENTLLRNGKRYCKRCRREQPRRR